MRRGVATIPGADHQGIKAEYVCLKMANKFFVTIEELKHSWRKKLIDRSALFVLRRVYFYFAVTIVMARQYFGAPLMPVNYLHI